MNSIDKFLTSSFFVLLIVILIAFLLLAMIYYIISGNKKNNQNKQEEKKPDIIAEKLKEQEMQRQEINTVDDSKELVDTQILETVNNYVKDLEDR